VAKGLAKGLGESGQHGALERKPHVASGGHLAVALEQHVGESLGLSGHAGRHVFQTLLDLVEDKGPESVCGFGRQHPVDADDPLLPQDFGQGFPAGLSRRGRRGLGEALPLGQLRHLGGDQRLRGWHHLALLLGLLGDRLVLVLVEERGPERSDQPMLLRPWRLAKEAPHKGRLDTEAPHKGGRNAY